METSQSQTPEWLTTAGILLGICVAIALFVVTMGNMGLIQLGIPAKAVAPDSRPVRVEDFQFTEPDLHVKAGETVSFELINEDVLVHSFDIDEFDVHVEMPQKASSTVQFTPTEPGIYTFYCGIPGHREAGMIGTLVVEP